MHAFSKLSAKTPYLCRLLSFLAEVIGLVSARTAHADRRPSHLVRQRSARHLTACLGVQSYLSLLVVVVGCIKCRLLLPTCALSVSQSVCHVAQLGFTCGGHVVQSLRALSVSQSVCHVAQLGFTCGGHVVQSLPTHLGLVPRVSEFIM